MQYFKPYLERDTDTQHLIFCLRLVSKDRIFYWLYESGCEIRFMILL